MKVSDIQVGEMDAAELSLTLSQVRDNLVMIRELIRMGKKNRGEMLTDYLAMESLLEAELAKRFEVTR